MESTSLNTAPFLIPSWGTNPGGWILDQANNKTKAHTIFKKFLENVPSVRDKVKSLIPNHINDTHLSISFLELFIIFIEEQIELIQSQRDDRNTGLDEKWNEMKVLIAQERYQLFSNQKPQLFDFVNHLKEQLKEINHLSENNDLSADFETAIDTFYEIIKNTHISDMVVAALFTKAAERKVPFSGQEDVTCYLSKTVLEDSFHLVTKQLYKNYICLSKRIVPLLRKERADKVLFGCKFLKDIDIRALTNQYLHFAKVLKILLSLDLQDDKSITMANNEITKSFQSFSFTNLSPNIQAMKNNPVQDKNLLVRTKTSEAFEISKDEFFSLIQCFEELQTIHFLLNAYFLLPLSSLNHILLALHCSMEGTSENKSVLSILPFGKKASNPAASKMEAQLLKDIEKEKQSKRQRRKNKNLPSKNLTSTPTSQLSLNIDPSLKTEAHVSEEEKVLPHPSSPIDSLRTNLCKLYNSQPSPALREMIWHLDQLTTLKSALKNDLQPEDYLNFYLGIANSTQKLLEQIYRYNIESKVKLNLKMHDLKNYHRMVFAKTPYPNIVNHLHLMNNWARDFHSNYEQLSSLTTTRLVIPPLLLKFAQLDLNPRSTDHDQFQKDIENIFSQGIDQANNLLPTFEIDEDRALNTEINIDKPIDIEKLQKVETALSQFLHESKLPNGHPSTLKIKQALSAFKMLKSSLKQLNQVQTTREFPTWVSWSLRQLQEGVEGVFHAIEFFKLGQISRTHELSQLASTLKLDMGSLGSDFEKLAYKSSYPAENLVKGKAAKLIDNAEAIHQWPDFNAGMTLQGMHSNLIWEVPEEEISVFSIMSSLTTLIDETESFLSKSAIPFLQESWKETVM